MKVIYLFIVIIYSFHNCDLHLNGGEICVDKRTKTIGTCSERASCDSANEALRHNIHPTLCSYTIKDALICCTEDKSPLTTIASIPTTTANAINEPVIIQSRFLNVIRSAANVLVKHISYTNFTRFASSQAVEEKLYNFPHMVAVGYLKNGTVTFKCGGSLISKRFVLTAAHCTIRYNRNPAHREPKVVRLGAMTNEEIDVNIEEIVRYPKYIPPSKYFDIALLKLNLDVEYTANIRSASISTDNDAQITSVIFTGYPTNVLGYTTSLVLQKLKLDILENEVCDKLLLNMRGRHWLWLKEHQICAGIATGRKETCQADSGGPLQEASYSNNSGISTYNIIGIKSFGRDCTKPHQPGVYTRISYFSDWINKIVQDS